MSHGQRPRRPERERPGLRDDVGPFGHSDALPARFSRAGLPGCPDVERWYLAGRGGPRDPLDRCRVPDLFLGGEPIWALARSAHQLPRAGGWSTHRVRRPGRAAGAGPTRRYGHHPRRRTADRERAENDAGHFETGSGPGEDDAMTEERALSRG